MNFLYKFARSLSSNKTNERRNRAFSPIFKPICQVILLFFIFDVVLSSYVYAENGYSRIKSHEIETELYLKEHKLKATDHICVQHPANADIITLFINNSFDILSVEISGKKLDYKTSKTSPHKTPQKVNIFISSELRQKEEDICLDITYQGFLPATPHSMRGEDVGKTTGIISEKGVYLSPSYRWYPDIPYSLASFEVTVIVPKGYEAVSQGILRNKESAGEKTHITWEEKNVSDGCSIVAGKYNITHINHKGINIYAYFFPEEQRLVDTYLNKTKSYLDMYQELIGKYPYGKFAIVENFFQTGYGMPSFTLLGSTVVKLPFIVDISLGHEVLHNWWGNSVFVDERQGNWCEGLTAYMADYYFKELKDAESAFPGESTEAMEYRKNICRKYTNYVTEENDFPLENFIGRTNKATQAIGYGKAAMVFHMLRKIVGDELFYKSLQKFYEDKIWQRAGWSDIQNVFEKLSGRELSWFFNQWIKQKGAPFLELGEVQTEKDEDGWFTKIEIRQKGNPYQLYLPFQIKSEDGTINNIYANVNGRSHITTVKTKLRPKSITIDPNYDVFRRLHIEEIPPTIDLILGDANKIIVYPTKCEAPLKDKYRRFAELLAKKKGMIKADVDVTEDEFAKKSLFIMGGVNENTLTGKLADNLPENFLIDKKNFIVNGATYENKGDVCLITMKNPSNRKKGIALFQGLSPEAIRKTGFKIHHYGKYSYLVFSHGRNIAKGVFDITNTPLQHTLN